MKQERIDPARLLPLDRFTAGALLRIDLAYAKPGGICGIVYRPGARLWLYDELAEIVVMAARLAGTRFGLRLVVYDGLRTVSAQALMIESPQAQANPHWFAPETRVLTPPGIGGHPRGMAVDVSLETMDGELLDMGTAFDELPPGDNGPAANRAHREFAGLPDAVRDNRAKLDDVMLGAAAHFGRSLLPLPIEWWDYRFPQDVYDRYAPLDDADLPEEMRMALLP